MIKYRLSKDKWDREMRKFHNGENPYLGKCVWVDDCDGLKVKQVSTTMGLIDIGDEYEYIYVSLNYCEKI